MSGGRFDYKQFHIGEIADDIERIICNNNDKTLNEWGDAKGRGFEKKTIDKLTEAMHTLRRAQIMAHRIDWLLSGDDGEDTFHGRWKHDLDKLENNKKDE